MPSVQTEVPPGGTTSVVAPSRRSLVRAGVTAAWTAPLVQVLAPAPAQAVGSGVVLALTGSFSHAAGNQDFKFTGTIANLGTQTTDNLQVTIVLTSDSAAATGWTGFKVQTLPSGWSTVSQVAGGSSGAWTLTTVLQKNTQMPGPTAATVFSPTIRCTASTIKSSAGLGEAVATATGATSSSTSNRYTA